MHLISAKTFSNITFFLLFLNKINYIVVRNQIAFDTLFRQKTSWSLGFAEPCQIVEDAQNLIYLLFSCSLFTYMGFLIKLMSVTANTDFLVCLLLPTAWYSIVLFPLHKFKFIISEVILTWPVKMLTFLSLCFCTKLYPNLLNTKKVRI